MAYNTRGVNWYCMDKMEQIIYWFLHSSGFTVPAPEPPRPLGGPRLLAGSSLSESESRKNVELRSARQTLHGATGSYIIIELVVILVKLIEVVVFFLEIIILERFASKVVDGTRNYLCRMSSETMG